MVRRHTFTTILVNTAHAATCSNSGCAPVPNEVLTVDIGNTVSLTMVDFPLPLVTSSNDYLHVTQSVVYTAAAAECPTSHPEIVQIFYSEEWAFIKSTAFPWVGGSTTPWMGMTFTSMTIPRDWTWHGGHELCAAIDDSNISSAPNNGSTCARLYIYNL